MSYPKPVLVSCVIVTLLVTRVYHAAAAPVAGVVSIQALKAEVANEQLRQILSKPEGVRTPQENMVLLDASLEGVSPSQRIAMVENWLRANQEALRASSEAAAAQAKAIADMHPQERAQFLEGRSQFVRSLDAIREQDLSPEERVRKTDELLVQHKADLDQQDKAALSSMEALRVQYPVSPFQRSGANSPLSRKEQLLEEISDLTAEANKLSPVDRIKALDAALPTIVERQNEISKIEESEFKAN